MDILVQIKDLLITIVYKMPPGLTAYFIRMGCLLALGSVFLYVAWLYLPWRNVFSQSFIAFLAITISLYIPVERFRYAGRGFLTFTTIASVLCMIYLPDKLSFWLTPRLGNQLRLKRIIVYVIWVGLLLQIIKGAIY
jgi:hypothetical protein